MWIEHDNYLNIVDNTWNEHVQGTKQFKLVTRLKSLKGKLKSLNERHFGHISERTKNAKTELDAKQSLLQLAPSNTILMEEVKEMKRKTTLLANAERMFYQQKAKTKFLIESDRCTKYFHSIAKRNRKKNFIATITREDGTSTTSESQVGEAFVEYYKTLLGTRRNTTPTESSVFQQGNKLPPDLGAVIVAEISNLEIKNALDSIGGDKAPGPDGYTSNFFKTAWTTIGESFCGAIREFFVKGDLLKQINHTCIALIPKSNHTQGVGDFRPISCCNVIYKVITKILSVRMKDSLAILVDNAQAAFVPGRNIVDNIHIMQELLRGYNRKRSSPRCTIKIDLKKAFDSVSWSFLKEVLEGFGFPDKFVTWIMRCVCSPTYSISINGSLHGFFKGEKGIRQGDSLSPFLFILCIEYLSRKIKKEIRSTHSFKFHPKCEKLHITHLVFADDLMLLSRGDRDSVGLFMKCLEEFSSVSGLEMNVSKSNIFTAGIGVDDDLGTSLSKGTLPFKYLGIPMGAENLRVENYSSLIQKVSQCISAWPGQTLSYAGKVELIRSIIQGVDCYWLAIFPIPEAIRRKISSLCRNFLWNGRGAPVAWKDICYPKDEGGLGLRDLKAWNQALLAKTLWNIASKKDSLWIKWVNQVFLNGKTIWEWDVHSRDSSLMKQLSKIRDKIGSDMNSREEAEACMEKWFTLGRNSLAYDYFRKHKSKQIWAKVTWATNSTPKHAFSLWLCAKRRLKTKDRFFQGEDLNCVFCLAQPETLDHLFFGCPWTSNLWNIIRSWVGFKRQMSTIKSALKWCKRETKGNSWIKALKQATLACTVYQIWSARNRKLFEGEMPDIQRQVSIIKANAYRIKHSAYPHVADFP